MSAENLTEHDEQIFLEEYENWEKDVNILYDCLLIKKLMKSSLTVQWVPGAVDVASTDYTQQYIMLGTNDAKDNYLIMACWRKIKNNTNKFEASGKIRVATKIKHEGAVQRARYMPKNPCIIATKATTADVLIFDYAEHTTTEPTDSCRPQLRLKGHTLPGRGISWHPRFAGYLISASFDQTICMWDINAKNLTGHVIKAHLTYTGHTGPVQDVAWHPFESSMFGSVSKDKTLMIWDTRAASLKTPSHTVAHNAEVNCLSFHQRIESYVATGSADATIAVWDLRNLKRDVFSYNSHAGGILQLKFSPFDINIFASASEDRSLHVYDYTRMPEAGDDEDVPADLMFIHGGHQAQVRDFDWNLEDPWSICSVADDKTVQVWKMAENISSSATLQQ